MFNSLSRVHIAAISSVLAVLAILVATFASNKPNATKKATAETSASVSIPTLTFGVYTSDKPSEMYKKFKPMLRYIEDEIADRIEDAPQIKLKIYSTYKLALKAFINDEVDFVRFGPASYVIAKQKNPDVRLLAIEEKRDRDASTASSWCGKTAPSAPSRNSGVRASPLVMRTAPSAAISRRPSLSRRELPLGTSRATTTSAGTTRWLPPYCTENMTLVPPRRAPSPSTKKRACAS